MRRQQKRTGLRWGLYARISKDKNKGTEDEGESVENQLAKLREYVAEKDPHGEIVKVYVDNDIPASGRMTKRKIRDDFDQMRDDARAGAVQAVAAWHLDRYTRRPRELEDMLDIYDEHGTLFHCKTGDINLATSTGRAMGRMLVTWGAYEGDLKIERMELAYENRARSGKAHSGGMRCYGYTDDNSALIDDEVAIIREMAERILPPQPESVRSLCRDLQERGILTVTGRPFTPTTIMRLLRNHRLRGARTYHEEVVAEDAFPRVFTDEEHAQIMAFLNDGSRKTFDEPRRRYLLSGGIAICGLCESKLQAQPSNSGRRGYVCRTSVPYGGCGKIRIQGEAFDNYVAAEVLARFASPKVRRQVMAAAAGDGASVAMELGRVDERLAELGRDWARGTLDRVALEAAQNELQRERRRLQQAMRDRERVSSLPVAMPTTPAALAEWWTAPTTTLDQQRDLILTVLDHVSVGPSVRRGFNGFEPDRLAFVWK
ncbi:recombinase family protein [Microbispora sp. RL4-1S]|uniref:Recombinase family protein n=1 Tax=Microbispora oryzae TaxID=2806554 RepID=A0A941AGY5_9ACTN|nr:recombinase family protein [Microbispora oryzae]MBP2703481.1 recombinase family protein [Microbispora oryzae]